MSLHLDPRQRAMLHEMGVQVWQPTASVIDAPGAADAVPAPARPGANSRLDPAPAGQRAPTAPVAPAPRQAVAPARPAPAPAGASECWRVGPAQPLYADSAQAGGARWLVLAQTPPDGLQAPAFDGDGGRLLDNMLRAARLHQDAGAVLFAPLVRQAIAGPMEEFSAALAALAAQARPDVVLVMGRLAAQALLQSADALGKLRGQPHVWHGCPAIVTYDAPYLLRCPQDKAKAWDDLCLAMALAARAA